MKRSIILLILLACSVKAMDHKNAEQEKETEEANKVIKHFCLQYWRVPYAQRSNKNSVPPANAAAETIVLPEFSPLYNLKKDQQNQANLDNKATSNDAEVKAQAKMEAQEDFSHLMKKLFPSDQH